MKHHKFPKKNIYVYKIYCFDEIIEHKNISF